MPITDDTTALYKRTPAHDALIAAAVGTGVFFVQALLIRAYADAFPFWDEWALVPMFKSYLHGTLSLPDLFARHNEHRIWTTRILSIATFALMGNVWHPIANMLVSAALNGILAGAYAWTVARLIGWHWLIVLSVACLVSPVQYENILTGFQISFYTLMLGVVGGACALALIGRLTWQGVAATLAGMFLAVFSMGGGVVALGSLWLGAALCAWRGSGSAQMPLRDRTSLARLGVVTAGGIVCAALFFTDYRLPPPPATSQRDQWHMLDYLVLTLAYPVAETTIAPWWAKIGGLFLIWGPILTACALLMRRGDHRLAVLFVVLATFIIGQACLLAIQRSGSDDFIITFTSPRHRTVLAWSSVLSLLSLAALLRMVHTIDRAAIRRALLVLYSVGSVVLIFFWCVRTSSSFEEARGFMDWRRTMTTNVRLFLRHPDTPPADPLPFPSREFLLAQLSDLEVQSILPPEITPGEPLVPQTTEGDAWTVNGDFPGQGPGQGEAPLVRYGSWSGDADRTGTFISAPLTVREPYLVVPIIGYPSRSGNRLSIEAADNSAVVATYDGLNPREKWERWVVYVGALQGREVRIVAVDGTRGWGGWLGIGEPKAQNRQVTALYWFLDHLEMIAAICLAGMLATFTLRNDATQERLWKEE